MSLSDEMRKYSKILFENRITDNPDVSYELKGKSGAAEKRGEFEKAIVTLTGAKSGVYTKYAREYQEIDNKLKELETLRDSLNTKVKSSIEELFDAEDAVYTRVVDTVSMLATLSKYVPPSQYQEEEFDVAGFMAELTQTASEELLPIITAMKAKYTKIVEKQKKEVAPRLSIKAKESINEENEIYPDLKLWADGFSEKIDQRLSSFDAKISDMKQKLPSSLQSAM